MLSYLTKGCNNEQIEPRKNTIVNVGHCVSIALGGESLAVRTNALIR